MDDFIGVAKLALRDQLLAGRRRLPLSVLGERARALSLHLTETPEIRRAATVAAYVSVSSEPGTGPLLDLLHRSGKRVILPLLQADNDLDWAVYDGPRDLHPANRGLLQPAGRPLGADAVATADAVLVPGLAVGRDGTRLGRGGGSYDRALSRVPAGTFVCVLLNSEEVIDSVPRDLHDVPVIAAATELGVQRLGA